MTITEHLQERLRVSNRIKWGGALLMTAAMVVLIVGGIDFKVTMWLVLAAIVPIGIGFGIYNLRNLRCPKCNTYFRPESLKVDKAIVKFCPKCGADFNEPYNPSPIS